MTLKISQALSQDIYHIPFVRRSPWAFIVIAPTRAAIIVRMRAAVRAFADAAPCWLRDGGALAPLGSARVAEVLRGARLVYVGEVHEQPDVLLAQMAVVEALLERRPAALHVVFEHWALEEQSALDALLATGWREQPALAGSASTGEGFKGVLAVARHCAATAAAAGVPLRGYAGFPTRPLARRFMSPGEEAAAAWRELWRGAVGAEAGDDGSDAAAAACDAAAAACLPGSDAQLAHFHALLSVAEEEDGCAWWPPPPPPPAEAGEPASPPAAASRLRRIFAAQTAKDACMALVVARAWRDLPPLPHGGAAGREDQGDAAAPGVVIALAGCGHVDYGLGVPERVDWLLRQPHWRGGRGGESHDGAARSGSPVDGRSDGDNNAVAAAAVATAAARGLPVVASAPPSLIVTARPALPPARISFPDGTVRAPGDLVLCYRHFEEDQ